MTALSALDAASGLGISLPVVRDAAIPFILIGCLLASDGTTTSYAQSQSRAYHFANNRFNRDRQLLGTPVHPKVGSVASQVMELRRLSGLTFDEMAGVLGVTRRSLHHWTNGRPIGAANEARVHRALSAIRVVNRGSARATRDLLMASDGEGRLLGDLIAEGKFEDLVERAGHGSGYRERSIAPISAEARAESRPLPPSILVDTRTDPIHTLNERFAGRSPRRRVHKL